MILLPSMMFVLTGLIGRLLRSLQNMLVLVQNKSREYSSSMLTVIDHRTGRRYNVPVAHNAIQALHLKAISSGKQSAFLNQAKDGLRVLDPGFQNTAAMISQITKIDGINGTIHYRKHSIDELFGHHGFEEVSYLLIWGHLPTREEKIQFRSAIFDGLKPPPLVAEVIKGFPSDAPPFSMIVAGLAAYNAYLPSSVPTAANNPNLYQGNMKIVDEAITRTISSLTVIVALIYCHQHNREFTPPDPNGSYISNLLLMMGFVDESSKVPSPRVVECLERLWVLYCDHELTNSTAAFLHVASTLADPISCCTAFIASGSGPLHGGAIDLAYKTFQRLETPDRVPGLIADAKTKKIRLFGYGHRIYKTVDPRTKFIRLLLDELSDQTKKNPLLDVALEIDRIASKDSYFTSRNLKVNADLYGCFVYTALGFEPEIITTIIMLSRLPGVMAHWREATNQQPRLWRPQQIFVEPET